MSVLTIIGMGPLLSYAIAERFGREEFLVAMIARREAQLTDFQQQLEQQQVQSRYFTADAADLNQLRQTLQQVHAQVGPTDVLVYNAASVHSTPLLEQSPEGLVQDFQLQVAGALLAAQFVLPHMQAQHRGTILLTGGGLAQYPTQRYTSVSVNKAALRTLTFTLAEALQGSGIHAGTVTINSFISHEDPKYNPAAIAEVYWHLHRQAEGEFETELSY